MHVCFQCGPEANDHEFYEEVPVMLITQYMALLHYFFHMTSFNLSVLQNPI